MSRGFRHRHTRAENRCSAVLFILLLMLLSSCASTGIRDNVPVQVPVYMTFTKKFVLLPAGCIENDIQVKQATITGSQGSRQLSLRLDARADRSGIVILLTDHSGTGRISYTGGYMSADRDFFIKKIRPEYLLADFQFSCYDICSTAEALEAANLHFTVETVENGEIEIRRIYSYSKCLEEITIRKDSLTITNHFHNYTYTVRYTEE